MDTNNHHLQEQLAAAGEWRTAITAGREPDQQEINRLAGEWREVKAYLAPMEKDEELSVVDQYGRPTALSAPRWLCHLLGLRHPTVHVLLQWDNPQLGPMYLLQVRSWQKRDYPGHLDISVGGHIGKAFVNDPVGVAYREMEEELGLLPKQLVDRQLNYCFGYENYSEDAGRHFYNREWNVVFTGTLRLRSLEAIHFQDGEVAGLFLCPEEGMQGLFAQSALPIAPALASYLQHAYGDY